MTGEEVTTILTGQEEDWSEEKLEESLRRLDDLHNRVLSLTHRNLYHYRELTDDAM